MKRVSDHNLDQRTAKSQSPFSAEELSQTPEASPELTKRSWFGSLMSTDRDETYTIIVKEKPLASIKADLIQAFLSVRYILVHFF